MINVIIFSSIILIILLLIILFPTHIKEISLFGATGLIIGLIVNLLNNVTNTNRIMGGAISKSTPFTIVNFNVMSEKASHFALAGKKEEPNQYDMRYKLIINELDKLAKKNTDLIVLEEVTEHFLNNFLQKWIANNDYGYTSIFRRLPLINALGQAIKKEIIINGKKIKTNIHIIQNLSLIGRRFQIADKYELSKKLDEYLGDLRKYSKVQIIPLYDNIEKKHIALSNIHLTGDKSPKGRQERNKVIELINEFINKELSGYKKIIIGDFNTTVDGLSSLNDYLKTQSNKLKIYGPDVNTSYSRFDYNRMNKIYSVKSDAIAWECVDKIITDLSIDNISTIPEKGLNKLEVPYKFIDNKEDKGDKKDQFKTEENFEIWPSDHTINKYTLRYE